MHTCGGCSPLLSVTQLQRGQHQRGSKANWQPCGRGPGGSRSQVRSDTPSLTRSEELQGTRQERRGSPLCERECNCGHVLRIWRAKSRRRAALRKFTIGLAGKFAPEQARILAKRLAGDVAHGIDPASAKTQKRNDPTVGELLDRYVREHIRIMLKPSTRWSAERLIKGKIRPRLGKTKLKELTRADISWHRSMSNAPVEANRALACFRKLLSLASGDWELLEQNPARGISPFPEQKRERVPTDEELRKLGAWLAQVEADGSELPGCVLAAKLMFFTAMRRGEVLGLEWSFIDLENGSARLPDAKSGRRTVPLA